MNIKLDENLPYQLVQLLTDLGHDVDTVPNEHIAGRDDDVVWAAAQTAARLLGLVARGEDRPGSDVERLADQRADAGVGSSGERPGVPVFSRATRGSNLRA